MTQSPRPPSPRVRLQDVADAAGVSKSIASKVLNDSAEVSVSPATRQRIRDAMEQLGYVPNMMARALSQSRTGTLACVFPQLTNPFYARVINAAYKRALERGFLVLVAEDSGEAEIEQSLVRLIDSSRVDGLVVASARPGHRLVAALAGSAMPHVYVNRDVPRSSRNVIMNDRQASEIVVRHFAELGHRRIAHLVGPKAYLTNQRRAEGFLAEARRLGLEVDEVECAGTEERAGYDAAVALFDRFAATGLYVSSLRRAIGALRALSDRGIGVPGDLSVVANDDLPIADYLVPAITTVSMPVEALGAAAIDTLVEQIEGKKRRDVMIEQTPRIIVRESTLRLP